MTNRPMPCDQRRHAGLEEVIENVIATDQRPKAIGPYSQAVEYGGLIYCSGQILLDPAAGQMVECGVSTETVRVLENLKAVPEAARRPFDVHVEIECVAHKR